MPFNKKKPNLSCVAYASLWPFDFIWFSYKRTHMFLCTESEIQDVIQGKFLKEVPLV